jgi:hypothetical protein
MTDKQSIDKWRRLRDALVDDIEKMSDAEIERAALDDGRDLVAQADAFRARAFATIASAQRARVQAASARARQSRSEPKGAGRPPFDELKRRVEAAFAADPSLALAFREGSNEQSVADLETLYDDLVVLGAIKNDADP